MLIKTDDQNFINIANAIRELTGTTELIKPSEMEAILADCVSEYVISFD